MGMPFLQDRLKFSPVLLLPFFRVTRAFPERRIERNDGKHIEAEVLRNRFEEKHRIAIALIPLDAGHFKAESSLELMAKRFQVLPILLQRRSFAGTLRLLEARFPAGLQSCKTDFPWEWMKTRAA
jgi:hypothetical protein